jgi:hypothetical protein
MPCHVFTRRWTHSGAPGASVAVAGFVILTLSNACSYFGSGYHNPCGALWPTMSENGRGADFRNSVARLVTTCV